MAVIRSILLTALILWPSAGWGQVFTSPRAGVYRGVGLQPEMQRGLISSGPSTSAGNREYGGFRGPSYPADGSNPNSDFSGASEQENSFGPDAANDPRYQYSGPQTNPQGQYGPATEGYYQPGAASGPRRNSPLGTPKRASPYAKPSPTTFIRQHSPSNKGGYFGILGAVGNPAVYAHQADRISLLELVALAGGATETSTGGVRIVRQGRSGLQTYLSANSTFEVLNGDIVYVESRPVPSQAGLQGYSQALRSSPDDSRGAAPAPKPVVPKQAYLGFVGLAARPVVVPVPADEATISAAMMWLKQDIESTPLPRIISPLPVPRTVNAVSTLEQLLPSGTILVFDTAAINQTVLPNFPPVVGSISGAESNGNSDAEQTSRPDPRIRGPVPRQFRAERPEFRTNSTGPRHQAAPPEIQSHPADGSPQRPASKPAVDPVGNSQEMSFDVRTDDIRRRTPGEGPMLVPPGNNRSELPQVNSPDLRRHGGPRPHTDRHVSPADGHQADRATATPAGFEDGLTVISNGPALGDPQGQEWGLDDPQRLNHVPQEIDPHAPQFQNAIPVHEAAPPPNVSTEMIPDKIPASTTPWYSSTLGLALLGSSIVLFVCSGLWIVWRFDIRKSRREKGEPLEDLLKNRLSVSAEAVRPPLGLRLHGRPPAPRVASNTVPAPHIDRMAFQRNTNIPHETQVRPHSNSPVGGTIPEPANRALELPLPARTISDRERNLRAEFQQARRERDLRADSNLQTQEEMSPSITQEINGPEPLASPHFISRPKILANVPRVNMTRKVGTVQESAADESAVLGRALENKRRKP